MIIYSFYCLSCHTSSTSKCQTLEKCVYCGSSNLKGVALRNPKQEGSNLISCKPQVGLCPLDCNQCYYNRPGAFYVDINEPHMPSVEDVGNKIVKVNDGHDSNIYKLRMLNATDIYKRRFFNTSIPEFDFPGPVVYTANRQEETDRGWINADFDKCMPNNLMFVRLRVSWANLSLVSRAVDVWTSYGVSVVLTFMAYYDIEPPKEFYDYRVRHVNKYWCASREFMKSTLARMMVIGDRLVTMCGTLDSNYCKDCRNCETYYWQTMKRIKESKG